MFKHYIRTSVICALLACLTGCLSSGGGSGDNANSPSEPTSNRQTPAYLQAVGIGVSDLDAAVALYRDGLGMTERQRLTRDNRNEVVMESADKRGSYVVLMQFTDGLGRNVQQNPGKLAFYVKDPDAFAADFANAGGRIVVPPTPQPSVGNVVVGFGRDQDNNLIEIVGASDATHSYLSAIGIGVTDLDAARDFYVETFGFEQDQFLSIPGQYDEYILTSPIPGGSALVLMHWTNGAPYSYQDNPIKLELASGDPALLAEAIEEAGLSVSLPPAPSTDADLNATLVGYAADADGTVLELRRSIRPFLAAAGVGVSDLDAAVTFYHDGLGMSEAERRTREDRLEVVMRPADGKGSDIVLMSFTDGTPRNYNQNPGKLVFYARDPNAFAQSIRDAGGVILVEPVDQGPALGNAVVGFGRDLDNNLIEIVGDNTATESWFGAFGIGVSDLASAKAFYADTLGFKVSLFLPIPGQYNEYILQGYGGSALVLMNWTNGTPRNYTDNPVKLEIGSLSPEGFLETIDDAGQRVDQQMSEDPSRNDELVGYARDADGTVLEVLLAPWGQTAP